MYKCGLYMSFDGYQVIITEQIRSHFHSNCADIIECFYVQAEKGNGFETESSCCRIQKGIK